MHSSKPFNGGSTKQSDGTFKRTITINSESYTLIANSVHELYAKEAVLRREIDLDWRPDISLAISDAKKRRLEIYDIFSHGCDFTKNPMGNILADNIISKLKNMYDDIIDRYEMIQREEKVYKDVCNRLEKEREKYKQKCKAQTKFINAFKKIYGSDVYREMNKMIKKGDI